MFECDVMLQPGTGWSKHRLPNKVVKRSFRQVYAEQMIKYIVIYDC